MHHLRPALERSAFYAFICWRHVPRLGPSGVLRPQRLGPAQQCGHGASSVELGHGIDDWALSLGMAQRRAAKLLQTSGDGHGICTAPAALGQRRIKRFSGDAEGMDECLAGAASRSDLKASPQQA